MYASAIRPIVTTQRADGWVMTLGVQTRFPVHDPGKFQEKRLELLGAQFGAPQEGAVHTPPSDTRSFWQFARWKILGQDYRVEVERDEVPKRITTYVVPDDTQWGGRRLMLSHDALLG